MKKLIQLLSVLLMSLSSLSNLKAGELEELAHAYEKFQDVNYQTVEDIMEKNSHIVTIFHKPIQPNTYLAIDDALKKCGYSYSDVGVHRNDIIVQEGNFAVYCNMLNSIMIGEEFCYLPYTHQEFIIGHECMHKKYNHGKIKQLGNYIGTVGVLFAVCVAKGWKRKIPTYFGLGSLNALSQLMLSRATEVQADIESIQLTGQISGGINFCREVEERESKHKEKLKLKFLNKGFNFSDAHMIVEGLDAPVLQTHPTPTSRSAYLREYVKTGKIPWNLCAKAVLGIEITK